ncbi:uncharacterized protein LOC118646557 [Monomorium pharaonis]|uniref:uncharacterized protein LOC118646557 n=1 Tax=Monomorium pharaonis TaxID=307658 RepID=UPI00174635D3|nr:uncharacterized protein LOC118646557 [Monomorium pharaonis]
MNAADSVLREHPRCPESTRGASGLNLAPLPRSTPLLRASGSAVKLRVVSRETKVIGVARAGPLREPEDEPRDEGGRPGRYRNNHQWKQYFFFAFGSKCHQKLATACWRSNNSRKKTS